MPGSTSRTDFMRIPALDLEAMRTDHVQIHEQRIEAAKNTLEKFKKGECTSRDLDKDTEELQSSQKTVFEFILQYKRREDLEGANSEGRINEWWVPLKENLQVLLDSVRKSKKEASQQDKAQREDEERRRMEQSKAAAREENQIKIKKELKIAKTAYLYQIGAANRLVNSGTKLAETATVAREDLKKFERAREEAYKAMNHNFEISEMEEAWDDCEEGESEKSLDERSEQLDSLFAMIDDAETEADQKKQQRCEREPEFMKKVMEAELLLKGTKGDSKGETRSSSTTFTSSSKTYIKKEAVTLADFFEQIESEAITAYPIWVKSWGTLIGEYDENLRAQLLRKHIGVIQLKILEGVSDDYKLSMRRLEQHFGDTNRLVRVIMDEINSFKVIKTGDHLKMVEFAQCIENSLRKLRKLNKEQELNNSQSMRSILFKFEAKTREDWIEHLEARGGVTDEFAEFVSWLEAKKIPLWKRLGCFAECVKPSGGGKAEVVGGADSGPERNKKGCNFCGALDHRYANCEKRKSQVCSHCKSKGHTKEKCFLLHPELKPVGFDKKREKRGKGGKGGSDGGAAVKGPGAGGGGAGGGGGNKKQGVKLQHKVFRCANCRTPEANHETKDCFYIAKNLGKDSSFRAQLIKHNHDCPVCLGDHDINSCVAAKTDCGCGKHHNQHRFSCQDAVFSTEVFGTEEEGGKPTSLLEFMKVNSPYPKKRQFCGVFWDNGATSNFITISAAKEFGFVGKPVTCTLQTIEGFSDKHYVKYKCKLKTLDGEIRSFYAYGVDSIMSQPKQLNISIVEKLFPNMKSWNEVLDCQRPEKLDFLLGNCRKSWLPERVERAIGGGDLWTMRNDFGTALGGVHPELTSVKGCDSNHSISVYHSNVVNERELVTAKDLHDLEFCGGRLTKEQIDMKYLMDNFNKSETLMVANSLACGRCSCGECALPGERFSFQGELDLKQIKSCLKYNEEEGRWYADLPWKKGYSALDLPETEKVAEKSMIQTEKSLSKNPLWEKTYNEQIQEFLDRKVARIVTQEEVDEYKRSGKRVYFLCHLAVEQPGKTTPVRLCIDGSREQMGGPSPNDLLIVGPKSYVNNLAGTLLCFRNGVEGAASTCDIKKMHQRVLLNHEATMTQLFKWRFCNPMEKTKIISIIVNTFGFVNANSMATASLHMSAEEVYTHFKNQIHIRQGKAAAELGARQQVFKTDWADSKADKKDMNDKVDAGDKFVNDKFVKDIYGAKSNWTENLISKLGKIKGAEEKLDLEGVTDDDLLEMWAEARDVVLNRSYIDDVLAAFSSKQKQVIVKRMIDLMLQRAGMPSKGWSNACEGNEEDVKEIGANDENTTEKTLGLFWLIKKDKFTFKIAVKFSGKKSKKSHFVQKWTTREILDNPPEILTRRMVLSELSKVFDPLGLICPVLLEAKILVRMSWTGDKANIPLWDDPLPAEQRVRWLKWFVEIHRVEEIVIRRSIIPPGEYEGLPDLVALADGSPVAFGAALYLVYRLLDGNFWSTLLCARSKIAKKGMDTVPRVELNGSLCAERLKNFVRNKTNIKTRNCYQLIDSEVVIHWTSGDKTDLGVYEGTRVSEIIATNDRLEDGGLAHWGHIDRKYNSADMCTRTTTVDQVKSRFWSRGPEFLYTKPVKDWPVNWKVYKSKLEKQNKEKEKEQYRIDFEAMYGTEELVVKDNNFYKTQRVMNLLNYHSDLGRVLRVLAWLMAMAPKLAKIHKDHKQQRLLRGQSREIDITKIPAEDKELSKEDFEVAKRIWIRIAQSEFSVDMEKELGREEVLKKQGKLKYKKTKYSKLAIFKDDDNIYRVGSRLRQVNTVTEEGNMPILLPEQSRSHYLQMKVSHDKAHPGEKRTILQFRRDGFWALNSHKVARAIIRDCYFCGEDCPRNLVQKMGDFKSEVMESSDPWSFLQMDLYGPFKCKQGRAVIKRWGIMLVDVVSGATYSDIVEDYSAASVIMAMHRFQSFFGWPKLVSSDPGSQLESAAGKLSEWWTEIGQELMKLAGTQGFEWNISPAKSPWYQGRVERGIGVLKRLLRSSVGDKQLSTLSLQTAIRSCVGIMNSRPINIDYEVDKRGEYKIITPNDLLLGRNKSCFDLSELTNKLKDSEVARNLEFVRQVQKQFYEDISTYVQPKYIMRSKWHYSAQDMPIEGDVVRVHEKNTFSKNWKMAVVTNAKLSKDGKVRAYELEYVILRDRRKPKRMTITRSSQMLSLLAKGSSLPTPVKVIESGVNIRVVPD